MPTNASIPPIRVRLIGAPSIATPVGTLSPAKPVVFAAALYLGLHRGRAMRREELASLLWPDADDVKRSERTRWLVRQLKLAGLGLDGGTSEISLSASDVTLDVDALAAVPSAKDALTLVGADVLAGYDPDISDRYSRWLVDTRDAWRAEILRALSEWLATTVRSRSWRTVEAIARRMLVLDHDRYDALRALEECLPLQDIRTEHADGDASDVQSLIGRDVVMARLLEGLQPSSTTGHRLGIAGPPGIGKSRVLEELGRLASGSGISVATVRCQRGDALRPLSLAVDLVRTLLELPGVLGASPDSIAVLRRFTGEETSPDDGDSAAMRRAAVYDAIRDLIGAVTGEGGLVVTLDDAQWADPGSWALLAPAVAQGFAAPLCWAVTIRTELREQAVQQFEMMFPHDDAVSEGERELLWLAPLDADDVGRLCVARAAPRVIPAPVLDVLVSRAAGIPFVAVALVSHWLELGDVSSLPPSVTRLVRARLDRLTSHALQLLRAIAVLGFDATPPATEVTGQLKRRELVAAVAELETCGILRATTDIFLSAHALWTEAAVASTHPATVQVFHRNAAEWLEHNAASQTSNAPRHHWAVAEHWIAAGDHERAQRALESAARVLAANGFIEEAATMLERAGDLAGVSAVALEQWLRAAVLWGQDMNQSTADAVGRIHTKYEQVARTLTPETFTPHHGLERLVKMTYARSMPAADHELSLRLFLSCATAVDATAEHRLVAAGRVLNDYGCSSLSREAAEDLWRSIGRIVLSSEREACEYEHCATQYYARVVDRPDMALAHADRLVAIVMTGAAGGISENRVLTNYIANVYERMGDVERSLNLRRILLEQGRLARNRNAVMLALNGLIGTLLELGRHGEARPLLAEFGGGLNRNTAHAGFDRARTIYRAVCALEEGNVALTRAELVPPPEMPNETDGMPRARILAIYAHLALLEGDDATLSALLPQLLACFVGRYAFVDHPALIAALALEHFQGFDAASAFVRRFVRDHRAERWTPRPELLRYLPTSSNDGEGDRHRAPSTVHLPAPTP